MKFLTEKLENHWLLPELKPLVDQMPVELPENDFADWFSERDAATQFLPIQANISQGWAKMRDPHCENFFPKAAAYNIRTIARALCTLDLLTPLSAREQGSIARYFAAADSFLYKLSTISSPSLEFYEQITILISSAERLVEALTPSLLHWGSRTNNRGVINRDACWSAGWFIREDFETVVLRYENLPLSLTTLPEEAEVKQSKKLAVKLAKKPENEIILSYVRENEQTGEHSLFMHGLPNAATGGREQRWVCVWTEEPIWSFAKRLEQMPEE
jgi:hypothetical protein